MPTTFISGKGAYEVAIYNICNYIRYPDYMSRAKVPTTFFLGQRCQRDSLRIHETRIFQCFKAIVNDCIVPKSEYLPRNLQAVLFAV